MGKIYLFLILVVQLKDRCTYGYANSLYSASDPLVQLNAQTFERTLKNSDTAWVVEFYASWCGHCQRFAPVWKTFATDVAGWSNVVRVAAVACSDTRNLPVCRSQNINGFPTVRFYPPKMQSVSRGYKLTSLHPSAVKVRDSTISFLHDYVTSTTLPYLKRFGSLQALLDQSQDEKVKNIMAIVEEDASSDNSLAQTVILDLSDLYPGLIIGRLARSSLPDSSLWQPLPSIVSVGLRDTSVIHIAPLNARQDAVKAVRDTLSGSRVNTATSTVTITTSDVVTDHPAHKTDGATGDTSTTESSSIGLSQSDLDANIYYSLWNEVAARSKIRGRALPALKYYLEALTKYHPSNERLHKFLTSVNQWIQRIGGSLDGRLYLNTIEGLQTDDRYVKTDMDWVACEGSQDRYRGYPCSLWMTFHSLTVGAYEEYLQNPSETFSPLGILYTIKNYVKHFFGCRDCAEHFLLMARGLRSEVRRPQDVILWLWRAHNRANNRLHGDDTEDPSHPKIQFPGHKACPTCRQLNETQDPYDKDTDWNEEEVLKYLRKFYSVSSIQRDPEHTNVTTPRVRDISDTQNQGEFKEDRQHQRHHQRQQPHHPRHEESVPATVAARTPSTTTPAGPSCVNAATEWSVCSATCGSGVSTRLSNNNSLCQMLMEMRLCFTRPCDTSLSAKWQKVEMARHCPVYGANYRQSTYTTLTFNNCTTVKSYRWRSCGLCPGYCCEPVSDGTFWADVTCQDSQRQHNGQVQVSWLINCECRPC